MFYVLRHYSLPVLLAFAIHAALVLFLWQGITSDTAEERIIKPKVINSTLLVLEPTKSKSRSKAPPPPAAPQAQPEAKPEKVDPRLLENQRRAREETRRKQLALERDKKLAQEKKREEEKLAREENERVRAAAERDRAARIEAAAERAKAERQARLDALSTSSVNSDAAADTEGEEAALAQTFFQGIYTKIVGNWSRPASARNGMKVTLRVELVPGGEVAAVSLVTSSGDGAFDRSAESAVRRSVRFDVPEDSAIFEKRFRRFNILFNPEDLLR
jgi:colicin import membrane protein